MATATLKRTKRSIVIERPPQDPDELHAYVYTLWGMNIPRQKVCDNHCAPFDAFCNAYFAWTPVSIWKGSRGLGGKSTMLATLVATEAVALGAQSTILGGSGAQSARVHEVQTEMWEHPLAPTSLLSKQNTMYTGLRNGAWIKSLLASQRSARGPHPQRLRLDEIDEMDLAIAEAAQGQPMDAVQKQLGNLILSQTVMSSTHQYPDKTMTEMLKRAGEKGWAVFEWCYRESMGTPEHPGWLTQSQVDRKRSEIPKHMWDTEYDLQEPSITGRAIEVEYVDKMFKADYRTRNGKLWDPEGNKESVVTGNEHVEYIIDPPVDYESYVTAVDWAQSVDWTIIGTWNTSVMPWRLVAFKRTGRLPWPVMIHHVKKRLDMYGGLLVHDSTGIGNVIDDFLDYPRDKVVPITMGGATRTEMFNDYIVAVEQEQLIAPRITYMYNEHKYVTLDDLYKTSGHPPDSFVMGALAWGQRGNKSVIVGPGNVDRGGASPWKGQGS